MYKAFQKYTLISSVGLALIGLVTCFIVYSVQYNAVFDDHYKTCYNDAKTAVFGDNKQYTEQDAKSIANEAASMLSGSYAAKAAAGVAINFCIFFMIIAGIGAIILPLVLNTDKKALIKPAIGVAAVGFIFLICWVSSSETLESGAFSALSGQVKFGGALIFSAITLLSITMIGVIVSELRPLFKN